MKTTQLFGLRHVIKYVLEADHGACLKEMAKYLEEPAMTGTQAFNESLAIAALLKHDAVNGGFLAEAMEHDPELNLGVLWGLVCNVVVGEGFDLKEGAHDG